MMGQKVFMLQLAGLPSGEAPEKLLNISHPDIVFNFAQSLR